jgi:hypothetical protein
MDTPQNGAPWFLTIYLICCLIPKINRGGTARG